MGLLGGGAKIPFFAEPLKYIGASADLGKLVRSPK